MAEAARESQAGSLRTIFCTFGRSNADGNFSEYPASQYVTRGQPVASWRDC